MRINRWPQRIRRSFSAALIAALLAVPLIAAPPAAHRALADTGSGTCQVQQQTNLPAKMRDGTTLYADVYRPMEQGTYPVILMRLPYNKTLAMSTVYRPPTFYASHCYIVVIQDVRGQYASGGVFYPFRNEMNDGYDSVEWAAALPGSNGKVGMYGYSYVGATQWLAATQAPPHLVAIAPGMTASDYYEGWTYNHGALSLAFAESWPSTSIAKSATAKLTDQSFTTAMTTAADPKTIWDSYKFLPIKQYPQLFPTDARVAPYFYDWVDHSTYDAYWQQWSIRERYNQITVPALNYGGWSDVFVNGTIENFTGMQKHGATEAARKGQKLVIGPYIHSGWTRDAAGAAAGLDFGPLADNPEPELILRWYDYWLKGIANGLDKDPAVKVFVMGANKWRMADQWPIPGTNFQKFYLHSDGSANTAAGNGWLSTEPPSANGQSTAEPDKTLKDAAYDHFNYDPANP
ncbi:MAG: hypothetical protein JWN15_2691, partial [Firmicutes bacterium]|nr:hypothetical protein [Bacillota bacterium]